MDRIIVPILELKMSKEEPGAFSCYGAATGNVDLGNDVIEKGAFADDVKAFATGDVPGMFWQHDPTEPVGSWRDMKEDNKGLKLEGYLWLGQGVPNAEKSYAMLNNPGPKGFSIGFKSLKDTIDRTKGIRTLQKLKTREISVVTFPMNTKARLLTVKSMSIRELEKTLRDDLGLSSSDAKALLSGGYAALTGKKRDASSELERISKALERNTNILKG